MTETVIPPPRGPAWRRAAVALKNEVVGVHPRLHAYNLAARLLPARASGELRARLLRLVGFEVGAGTSIEGELRLTGDRVVVSRLVIGRDTTIGGECTFDLLETLTIGDRVTIEPGVMILTSTHELDAPVHRAGPLILNPVTIGDGAWIRARAIILPGVKIGEGAVVEAGAVVNKSVEPDTRVGGIPANKLEALGGAHA
jgi:acetyltransferase-like isoleucine patch superfamily enzyme